MRTRVKICGITRPEDAIEAARLGADAIGLVFAASSPRYIAPRQAVAVANAVPPFVTVVGLFMNANAESIAQALEQVPLGLLQFHGDEAPELCRQFGVPYIKAVPMGGGVAVHDYVRGYDDAAGFLLDSHVKGGAGGGGKTFAWADIPDDLPKPLILAGGLTPANVAEGIRRARPFAVDVSSGVEAAKGIKDAAKMAAFIRGVQEGDRTISR